MTIRTSLFFFCFPKCFFVGAKKKLSRYMDEVISRSGQFKKEDDRPLPKTSCQRQQICDNVVKVKFGLSNLISIFDIGSSIPKNDWGINAEIVCMQLNRGNKYPG